jgi:glycosyltransferase involved in cell wall biosynthesis
MKILHVVASISEHDGGPGMAVLEICRILNARKQTTLVVTTDFDGPDRKLQIPCGTPTEFRGVDVLAFPMVGKSERQKKSPEMEAWLRAHSGKFDLIHVHGLFSHPTHSAVDGAIAANVPFVISPCGALMEPNLSLANPKNLLKRAYIHGVERKYLAKCGSISFTSRLERDLSAAILPPVLRQRSQIMALGLGPEALEASETARLAAAANKPGKPLRLGFLGRLHPIKGFDLWLAALGHIHSNRLGGAFELSIAGPPTEWSKSHLEPLLEKSGLKKKVRLLDRLDGEAKWNFLADLDVLLLPSYLENFGLVAVEAMACGTPVLATDQVGVADEIRAGSAGWVTPVSQQEITDVLVRLLSNPARVTEAASRARDVAVTNFSHDALRRQIDEVYRSLGQTMVGE